MRVIIFILLTLFSLDSICQNIEFKLQASLDSIYQAHPESVGIMVHVEAPDKNISWSGASGYSNKATKERLDAKQPALIASSIKTYVAATILRMVEEEKIQLNQTVGDLLTEKTSTLFTEDGYNLQAIQVKHLLSHTSGIEDYANEAYIEYKDEFPMKRWTR
ncbi:MAG: serine hydrolase, partial [Bacteroidota bacterium]